MSSRQIEQGCPADLAAALTWIAGLGAVTAEALARDRGWSVPSARARLARAERAGLLSAWRPLRAQPSLYTVTRAGLRAAGVSGIEPGRVSAAGARHAVVCSLVAAELGRTYDGRRVIGEAELRREERSGALLVSTAAGCPGGATHRPDLALVATGARPGVIAVEVELTVKSPRRLRAICLAWARARQLDGVVYLAAQRVRPALERAIEESRSGARIAVLALETLEGDGGGGALERAVAAGA